MTSTNTIDYTIYDLNNITVGHHSQNVMCSTCHDGLEKFTPAENFTIESHYYDEEEELQEGVGPINLKEWLSKNKAGFTFRRFVPGDHVKLFNKLGEGTIVEVIPGMFMPSYNVKLDSTEEIIEVGQNKIIPPPII